MIEDKPLISVFVPAYNEEKTIKKCLSALKNQDFPGEYEILAVNNASTDKTREIIKSMNINVVDENKKGYGYALKKGFDTVKSDLVAVTDADTQVSKDWLFNIYQAFKKDDTIAMVGGKTLYKPLFPLALVGQFVLNVISGPIFKIFPGYTMAFRKSAYQKAGGVDTRFNFNIDTDLCLRVNKLGKTVFLYNNPITVSSRHYRGVGGIKYSLKGVTNAISLMLFKKTPFFHFGDIRE